VIVAALAVLLLGWRLADPVVAAVVGLLILPRTWSLLGQAVNVLLEGTPAHIDLGVVERVMRDVAGVRQVHDLHVWTLTSGKYAMSAHAVVDDIRAGERILRELHEALHARFGIDHTTIQLEPLPLVQIGGSAP
jgi:cobalt-zinc-cadmium efflux system protein